MIMVKVDGVDREATLEEVAEMEAHVATAVQADMAAYLTTVRALRERILNRLTGIATAALVAGDQSVADSYALARQRLLDITTIPADVAAATNKEELETAIKQEYAAIVTSVAPSLKSAFDKVDQ